MIVKNREEGGQGNPKGETEYRRDRKNPELDTTAAVAGDSGSFWAYSGYSSYQTQH